MLRVIPVPTFGRLVAAVGFMLIVATVGTMPRSASAAAPVFAITSPTGSSFTSGSDTYTISFAGTSSSTPAIVNQAWGVQDDDTGTIVEEGIFTGASFSNNVTLNATPAGKPYTLLVAGVNSDTFATISMGITITKQASYKVLILIGDTRESESSYLTTVASVGDNTFTYESVNIDPSGFDGDMRSADIVWFPWNGPGHDGDYFMAGTEATVDAWVQAGGAIWISAFDDNFTDGNGDQVGAWMPIATHPITVLNEGNSDSTVTAAGTASGLFSQPNTYDLDVAVLDDSFSGLDASWVILSDRDDNGDPAACYLQHGSGVYLEVCIDTRNGPRGVLVEPLIENGLQFLGDWISEH